MDEMPRELGKAQRNLDTAVDKLYRSASFSGDRDRVEYLFELYEKLVAPLAAATPKTRRARPRPLTQ